MYLGRFDILLCQKAEFIVTRKGFVRLNYHMIKMSTLSFRLSEAIPVDQALQFLSGLLKFPGVDTTGFAFRMYRYLSFERDIMPKKLL